MWVVGEGNGIHARTVYLAFIRALRLGETGRADDATIVSIGPKMILNAI